MNITGYCDVDSVGDQDDRKSTSGYIFILGGRAISWASKKQTCVAHYTMEAEFMACSTATIEAVWLKRFLENIKFDQIFNNKVI